MADISSIHKLLTEMTRTTAFTSEALKQFQDAIDKAKELENELNQATKDRDYYRKLASDGDQLVKRVDAREAALKKREDAIAERESKMNGVEKELAVAVAKESVRKEVFDTLFKNTVVRRAYTDMVSGGSNVNGVYNNTSSTHNVNETTQEE